MKRLKLTIRLHQHEGFAWRAAWRIAGLRIEQELRWGWL
jgi:hypothetical protein